MRYFVLCLTFILLHNFACGLHRGNNVEWRERVGRVGWVRARLDSTSEGTRYIRGWWWWWWWTPHQREAGHIEDDRDDQYGHDIGPEHAVDDHTGPDVVLMMMSLTMLMPVLMMSKWECRKEEGWSRQSWREGTRAHPASTQFTLGRRACVAFVTNIFMDIPSNYLCGVMIESIWRFHILTLGHRCLYIHKVSCTKKLPFS